MDYYDLRKSAHKGSKSPTPFIDLSAQDVPNNLYEKLARLLESHQVNIVVLEGKGESIIRELSQLGIKHEVYGKIT